MQQKENNAGSIWRRWDPHIHTPGTVLNDQFGDEAAWEDFLQRIETSNPQIEVLGITDYYSLDNYEKADLGDRPAADARERVPFETPPPVLRVPPTAPACGWRGPARGLWRAGRAWRRRARVRGAGRGEREVKLALRKTLFKYRLHQDQELFERAYGYIREYY